MASVTEQTCEVMRASLADLVSGADMVLALGGTDAFSRYATEVKRVAAAALAWTPPEAPTKPRWKCPHCGSTDVQISLPTWYYETTGMTPDSPGDLTMIETDCEAEISWWSCDACGESNDGDPDANDD